MNRERQDFQISHVYSLWQDLSHHTTIFYLMTLTLNFEWHSLNDAILIWLPLWELCCLLTTLVKICRNYPVLKVWKYFHSCILIFRCQQSLDVGLLLNHMGKIFSLMKVICKYTGIYHFCHVKCSKLQNLRKNLGHWFVKLRKCVSTKLFV